MRVRLFKGKEHALYYWKYRISPSEEIINKILNFLEKHVSNIAITNWKEDIVA